MLQHEFYYQHVKQLQAEERERARLGHLAHEGRPHRADLAQRLGYRSRLALSRLLIGLGRRVTPV